MTEKNIQEHSTESPEPNDPVNLRRIYPIAIRSVFKRSLHWILVFLMLIIAITVFDNMLPGNGTASEKVFFMLASTMLTVGSILLAGKLLYEVVYFYFYYYSIELDHVIVSRGVFFKTRASFPLARLAVVNFDRDIIDFLFLLHNIRITTTSTVVEIGSIEGLSIKNATALQNYFLALTNTTLRPVDEDQAQRTLSTLKATEDPMMSGKSPVEL